MVNTPSCYVASLYFIFTQMKYNAMQAFAHSWNSYEKYAMGYDELQPQSRQGKNMFGGLGATIIDSIDTAFIMGNTDAYNKIRDWVADNFNPAKNYDASVFETTIRCLGGLISAYDLTQDKIFLAKARELADRLLPAFNTRNDEETGSIKTSLSLSLYIYICVCVCLPPVSKFLLFFFLLLLLLLWGARYQRLDLVMRQ